MISESVGSESGDAALPSCLVVSDSLVGDGLARVVVGAAPGSKKRGVVKTVEGGVFTCISKAGSGKPSGIFLPSVLAADRSCVFCFDARCDFERVTGQYRAGISRVLCLDLDGRHADICVEDAGTRLNVLGDFFIPESGARREAYFAMIAQTLVGRDMPMSVSAAKCISVLLREFMARYQGSPDFFVLNFSGFREVCLPAFAQWVLSFQKEDYLDGGVRELFDLVRASGVLSEATEDFFGDVMKTVNAVMSFLVRSDIRRVTEVSDIEGVDLCGRAGEGRSRRKPISVYVSTGKGSGSFEGRLASVFMQVLLYGYMKASSLVSGKDPKALPVLVALDDMSGMGVMPALMDFVKMARKREMTFLLGFWSSECMRSLYGGRGFLDLLEMSECLLAAGEIEFSMRDGFPKHLFPGRHHKTDGDHVSVCLFGRGRFHVFEMLRYFWIPEVKASV